MAKRMKNNKGKHYVHKATRTTKRNKINIQFVLLVWLIVLILINTNKIFAYLTDSSSRTNQFTVGSTYTVTFDSNGGTGTMENQFLIKNVSATLSLNTFTKEEYNFLGWNTMPDGSGASYDDGQEVINLPTDSNNTITLYAQWAQGVAIVNGTLYSSLQTAITDGVPDDKTETIVKLLKNVNENITINNGKNVVLNLQSYTLGNVGNAAVITNHGILKLYNGTIKSDASANGAINNEATGNIKVSGGQVITIGGRQALYNNKGKAEISGDAYLSSASTIRSAVQNVSGGTLSILGGTIVSTGHSGVNNLGNMTIGTKDGNVDYTSPDIRGVANGVLSTSSFKFYDGIIKGKTAAISDVSKVTDKESGYIVVYSEEVIDGATYKTAYLDSRNTANIQFNTNGGYQTEKARDIITGNPIGTLPVPVKSGRIFDGWFTAASGGTQITENDIVSGDSTYYAHWHKTNGVAQIGDVIYDTLEDAVAAVPTNGTQTTIHLLKDASETIEVKDGRNVVFDLGSYTLSNCWDFTVIKNMSKTTIVSGTITSNVDHAAVDNDAGSLLISGGSIIATGSRQAVYVGKGTAEITGTAYLSSTATGLPTTSSLVRGTVQALEGTTLKVTGGTIVGNINQAISNEGTLTIGVDDGTADASSPKIIGKTCGVLTSAAKGTTDFYDGIIKGVTNAIEGPYNYDQNFVLTDGTEVIDGTTYKTLCLT